MSRNMFQVRPHVKYKDTREGGSASTALTAAIPALRRLREEGSHKFKPG